MQGEEPCAATCPGSFPRAATGTPFALGFHCLARGQWTSEVTGSPSSLDLGDQGFMDSPATFSTLTCHPEGSPTLSYFKRFRISQHWSPSLEVQWFCHVEILARWMGLTGWDFLWVSLFFFFLLKFLTSYFCWNHWHCLDVSVWFPNLQCENLPKLVLGKLQEGCQWLCSLTLCVSPRSGVSPIPCPAPPLP